MKAIDKSIARMKGFTLEDHGTAGIWIKERNSWLKDISWSTFLNCWELWEELPEPKIISKDDTGYLIVADMGRLDVISHRGDSLIDVVQKIWMKFKKKKKGEIRKKKEMEK